MADTVVTTPPVTETDKTKQASMQAAKGKAAASAAAAAAAAATGATPMNTLTVPPGSHVVDHPLLVLQPPALPWNHDALEPFVSAKVRPPRRPSTGAARGRTERRGANKDHRP